MRSVGEIEENVVTSKESDDGDDDDDEQLGWQDLGRRARSRGPFHFPQRHETLCVCAEGVSRLAQLKK